MLNQLDISARKTFRVALLVALFIDIFSLSGCSKKPDSDELVLIELKKAGSDLSKPHKIDFYLYFPTQSVAEQVALRIRDAGFKAEVKKGAKGDNWLCLATKTMVPELSAIKRIGRDFENLAAPLKGDYDGWETGVEK